MNMKNKKDVGGIYGQTSDGAILNNTNAGESWEEEFETKFVKYRDYHPNIIKTFIKELLVKKGLEDFRIFREERDKAVKQERQRIKYCLKKQGINPTINLKTLCLTKK
jgi:hypothetical protein